MHIEPVVVLGGRAAGSRGIRADRVVELPARPLDRQHRLVIHALARSDRGAVVIAEQRDARRARRNPSRCRRQSRDRRRSRQVAEKDVAVDRVAPRMRETRLERLAVAVDVGEQGDQHWRPRRNCSLTPAVAGRSESAQKNGPDPEGPGRRIATVEASRALTASRSESCGDGAPIGRVAGAWLLTGRGG